ncbi:MAG: GtrA family protein [Deltaproteobacteria bacterium]|nr:MAG: GtrA family protein [Deltaproteobacteria bacterium]
MRVARRSHDGRAMAPADRSAQPAARAARLARVARSGACGAIGSAADLAALVVLVERAAAPPAAAAAVAALCGACVCFALNRRWAFRDRSPLRWRQVGRFAVVAGGAAALNAAVVGALVGVLRGAYLAAKAVSACVVFATWTYPTQARLVFAPRGEPS